MIIRWSWSSMTFDPPVPVSSAANGTPVRPSRERQGPCSRLSCAIRHWPARGNQHGVALSGNMAPVHVFRRPKPARPRPWQRWLLVVLAVLISIELGRKRGWVVGGVAAVVYGGMAVASFTWERLRSWSGSWGEVTRSRLDAWISQRPVIPYDLDIARTWARLSANAQQRGRPRPQNDTWVAACCIRHDLPCSP